MTKITNMTKQYNTVHLTNSADETEAFAKDFAKNHLNGKDFIALYGDLGVGKTAFVRGLAQHFTPDAEVSSPTYAIVNEYAEGTYRICHFDMYRITDDDDLYSIGFYDYEDALIVCEWSENIPYALPERYFKITIEKTECADQRRITVEEIIK